MTEIRDNLTYADGRKVNGLVVVWWQPFLKAGAVAIAGGMVESEIVDGVLDLSLESNAGSQPTNNYYTAKYELENGALYEEYWVIPALSQASLAQVRVAHPVQPSVSINPIQLTSMGASAGMFIQWNGTHWIPGFVTNYNFDPNNIRFALTATPAPDLSWSPASVVVGETATLNVPDASPTARGVVTAGAQTFGGPKTIQGDLTVTGILTAGGGSFVPATRKIIAGAGMSGGGPLTADVTLNALVTSVFGRTGAVVLTPADVIGAGGVPTSRTLTAGTGLTGGGDLSMDRGFAVQPDTTVQQVRVSRNGSLVAARREINFIPGANTAVAVADDPPPNNRVNVTISSTGGMTDPTANLGDLIVRGPSALDRLPVGGNGQVLTADNAQALGVKWAAAAAAPDDTSNQRVQVALAGVVKGTRPQLNFIAGSGTAFNVADIAGSNRVDVTVSLTGSGPASPSIYSVDDTVIGTRAQLNLITGANTVLTGVDNAGASRVDITVAAKQSPWTSDIDGGGHSLTNAWHIVSAGQIVNNGEGVFASTPSASEYVAMKPTEISWRTSGKYRWAITKVSTETGSNNGSDLAFSRYADDGSLLNSPLTILRSNGNVGIAKTNPAYPLDVTGDVNITGTYRVNGVPIGTGGGSQTPWTSDIEAAGYTLNNAGSLYASGSVTGIEFSPIHRGGADPAFISTFTSWGNNTYVQAYGVPDATLWCHGTNAIVFRVQDPDTPLEAMRITSLGNAGIGTSVPYSRLTGVGDIGFYAANTTSAGFPVGASLYLGEPGFNSFGYYNSAPGISAVYDPIFSVAAALAFYTYTGVANSRTERMRITYAGVGIGTTSPAYALDVSGDVNLTGTYRMGGVPIASKNAKINYLWSQTGGSLRITNGVGAADLVTVLDNGNVGINVSPAYKLDVAGDINITGTYRVNGVPIGTGGGGTPAGATGQVQWNNAGAFGASANLFWDSTNSRLGIGTTTPGSPLSVMAANGVVSISSNPNTGYNYITLSNNGGQFIVGQEGSAGAALVPGAPAYSGVIAHSGSYPIVVGIGGSERVRITASGNVGIGNTNPSHKLSITSGNIFLNDPTQDNALFVSVTSSATSSGIEARNNAYSAVKALSLNAGGGNVGIGTTTPGYTLDVKGSANVVMRLTGGTPAASSNNCQIRWAGSKDGELWIMGPDSFQGSGSKNFYFVDIANAGSPFLCLQQGTGCVGIGTIPTAPLTIYSTTNQPYANGMLQLQQYNNGNYRLSLGMDGGLNSGYIQCGINGGSTLPLHLNPVGGSVGIGVPNYAGTNPQGILDIRTNAANSTAYIYYAGNVGQALPNLTGGPNFALGWNVSGGAGETDFFNCYTSATTSFSFRQMLSASTSRVLLEVGPQGNVNIPNGTLSIGVSQASQAGDLNLARTSAPTTGAVFFGNSGSRYLYWDGTNFNFNGPLLVQGSPIGGIAGMMVQNNAGTPIGPYPYFNFQPSANISWNINQATPNTLNISAVYTASDARLKQDVATLTGGLSIIEQLRPIRAEWNGLCGHAAGQPVLSVIAQELQSVIPDAVYSFRSRLRPEDSEDTDLLGIEPMAITAHLILAVQQLSKRIEALEGRKN